MKGVDRKGFSAVSFVKGKQMALRNDRVRVSIIKRYRQRNTIKIAGGLTKFTSNKKKMTVDPYYHKLSIIYRKTTGSITCYG